MRHEEQKVREGGRKARGVERRWAMWKTSSMRDLWEEGVTRFLAREERLEL